MKANLDPSVTRELLSDVVGVLRIANLLVDKLYKPVWNFNDEYERNVCICRQMLGNSLVDFHNKLVTAQTSLSEISDITADQIEALFHKYSNELPVTGQH